MFASRDPGTPLLAKLLALATVAYALSPVDLIPDFIPVLGNLDDLIVLPLGVWLCLRLIPKAVIEDNRGKAEVWLVRPWYNGCPVTILSVRAGNFEAAMATANVGRYVVVTKERYARDASRSECFVGIDGPDLANVLFREGDCSPPFDGPEVTATSALQRGVNFARSLGDPEVIGLLTLHS